MPLPANNVPWPPTDPTVRTSLADWSAWYSGDPDKLTAQYRGRSVRQPSVRPSQLRNGVVGRFARWWWGQPTAFGEQRAKLHVPLAADISRASADLLFSEPPRITVTDAATQDRIDQLITGGLHATLLEGAEIGSALGGVYLRVVWDKEVRPTPWVTAVHADGAAPEFRYGVLTAVTFWTVIDSDGQKVVRQLERHEPGVIFHGVYEGTLDNLGRAVPLAEYEQTQPLADLVDSSSAIKTGAPKLLTAAYLPNMRPARAWRDVPAAAYWGASDYQGVEGLFDALDETYSSWMRDIRLAKGRILLSQQYLTSTGPGQGASFDEDREAYAALNIPPTSDQGITLNQFAIRHLEHKATIEQLTQDAIRMAGYSTATFGEPDGSAMTATEVRAKQARTLTTRGRKVLYTTPGLGDILEALLAVEAGSQFGGTGITVERPAIEWQDSISESPQDLAQTATLLDQAHAASTAVRVQLVHPDWDDERVQAETEAILRENGMGPLADPAAVGAGGFDLNPPGREAG
ncbi:SPP1 Gp6-like portal protein [Streptomyces sp. TLI_235]|nr:phage portal protein [Streptomyces sp. TLI_235]PBC80122.1 SPP1 Gp6-like portal protein [Streptomyces sp. TLI_235]